MLTLPLTSCAASKAITLWPKPQLPHLNTVPGKHSVSIHWCHYYETSLVWHLSVTLFRPQLDWTLKTSHSGKDARHKGHVACDAFHVKCPQRQEAGREWRGTGGREGEPWLPDGTGRDPGRIARLWTWTAVAVQRRECAEGQWAARMLGGFHLH